MTQAQLAVAAGTSQPTLAAYESGAKSPSIRTLDRIIRAAGGVLQITVTLAPAAEGALLLDMRQHRRAIQRLARERGIRSIRIFGSVARGEETPTSDVDVLVDFNTAKYGVLPLAGFARDMQQLLGRRVNVSTVDLMKDSVRTAALSDAVPL
jgi:predicted nucleotidyltransferase